MAVVLLRLKLTTQRRAWGHSGAAQRALFVGGWLVAVVLGVAAGGLVSFAESSRQGVGDLALLMLLTVIFIGWVLGPILLPGVADQSADPVKLEQFPLAARDQVSGLLLGALVAPTALFTFLVAAGGTFATGETASARVAVVLAAALFTILCITASRSVQATLARVLSSRRGRDVAIAASGVLALAAYLLSQGAHNITNELVSLESGPIQSVLSWLPSGAIGQGMLSVRDGDWGTALIHLAVALIAIALFVSLWAWAIRRQVRGTSGSAGSRRKGRSEATFDLIRFPLTAVEATTVTGAASQQLRYFFFRSPRAIQAVALSPVIAAVFAHTLVTEGDLIIGSVIFAAFGVTSVAVNAFAFDDKGYAYLMTVGARWRQVLAGKAVAGLVVFVPLIALFVVVESIINDVWADAVAALLASLAILIAGVGIGSATTVLFPVNRVTPSGGGSRALAGALLGMVGLLVVGLLAAMLWAVLGEVNQVVPASASLVLASLVAWGMLRWAGARLAGDPWRVQQLLHV